MSYHNQLVVNETISAVNSSRLDIIERTLTLLRILLQNNEPGWKLLETHKYFTWNQ